MKKVFWAAPMNKQAARLFEANGLEQTQRPDAADIVVYAGGGMDELFERFGPLPKARTVMPASLFMFNESALPVKMEGQRRLARLELDDEDIREVSRKTSDFVSSLRLQGHFGELGRFLKSNALELAQNALIHKRLNGLEGRVTLEVFETPAFYNLRVTDPFGALEPALLMEKLSRASREKTHENKAGGAGLGLRMVVNSSDCSIFRVNRGKRTQVCCIINKYKRLKQFKEKSPALFVDEEE